MSSGKPWEPDPAKMGNWTSLFEQQRKGGASQPPPSPSPAVAYDDAEVSPIDQRDYKPWTLQRGPSRGSMMLGLRWHDPKSGLWHGSALAYPSLFAIDTIGDRMVSLDFGTRQFVLEGRGLDQLTEHLERGVVSSIVEFSSAIWQALPTGPMVRSIKPIVA